jgi:hypothetical protein
LARRFTGDIMPSALLNERDILIYDYNNLHAILEHTSITGQRKISPAYY